MTVNWRLVDCDSGERREKLFVIETGSRTFKIQPIDFRSPIKWMKLKGSAEGSKTLKTKDPAKAKADYYYFEGKVKGPPLKAPVHLQMQLDDKEKTRIKSGSS